MEGYFKAGERKISLVVLLVDMRRKPTEDDYAMISFLKNYGIEFITVLTKSDKLNKTQYKERLEAAETEIGGGCKIIPFSALNGNGIDDIKRIIETHLEK